MWNRAFSASIAPLTTFGFDIASIRACRPIGQTADQTEQTEYSIADHRRQIVQVFAAVFARFSLARKTVPLGMCC